MEVSSARNGNGYYSKDDVLSVSGDLGIVNQIELLGRSYAGESVLPYRIVEINQVVYTKSPLASNPYGIIKTNCYKAGIVSTLYAVYKAKENCNPHFVQHYFDYKPRINNYLRPIVRIGAKHDMKIGNQEVLRNIVYFPSLCEQNKISVFLDLINERIITQNKIIEDLITLRNQINNVFFDSLNTCVRFSELYTFASEGGTPDTSKGEYYLNGKIPFIKIENLYEKYLLSSNSFISESGLRNSSAWLVPKESILLSNGATIGETTILKMDATTKQGILGIIPKKPYDSEILYYLFKSRRFAKTLKRITTKGTMEAAYLKDLNKEKVFLSCDENMNSHVTLMSLIDKRINVERQIAHLLVIEKQYLLGNLFI